MTEKYIWVAYAKTPPHLPVAVADSAPELARLMGTSPNVVMSTWSHYNAGRKPSSRFHRVAI